MLSEFPQFAVYGTLRRGQGLDHVWLGHAQSYPGYVRGWRLYQPIGIGFPVAYFCGDRSYKLRVELIVPHGNGFDLLKRFDIVEGYPRLYQRAIVTVELFDGDEVDAWIYTPTQPLDAWEPVVAILSNDWTDRTEINEIY